MDHKALSALIIRISGLLVIVYSVTNAARDFGPYFDPETTQRIGVWTMAIALVVSVAVPVLLGLFLVYFPSTIATRVLKVEGTEAKAEDVRPLQRVAFSAIGLWLTLFAVIDATYFFAKTRLYIRYIEDLPMCGSAPPFMPDDFGGFVSCAVQLVIGIWLLVGSRGFVNVLARIRR